MKRIHFDTFKDGFHGSYFKCKNNSNCAIITMLGDDSDDYMARTAAKWLNKLNVNVLTMSVERKSYSYHNYPLERIENAIKWLKQNGNNKIGITGASTTGTLALTASSYFNDITLTIAMTPSDFIWQGFAQGNKDGCKEWPIDGESLFTYRGVMLPYMPFCYQHPDYWNIMIEESKKNKDMINSLKIFNDSEVKHPLLEEEMIKVEKINGKLLLIGACDDSLWDTAKYIHRIEKRLSMIENNVDLEAYVYEHGTHFVFPESLIKMMFPIGSNLFVKLAFSACKKYSKDCKKTRIDIDLKIKTAIRKWSCK